MVNFTINPDNIQPVSDNYILIADCVEQCIAHQYEGVWLLFFGVLAIGVSMVFIWQKKEDKHLYSVLWVGIACIVWFIYKNVIVST